MIRIPKPTHLLQPFWAKPKRPGAVISSTEIEAVAAHYDLGHWQMARTLAGGNSDNILLQTSGGRKVLKRYRWSLDSTKHEHSILSQLAGTDFPFPHLEVSRAGLTYTELDNHHYAIYEFIPGYCYTNYLLPMSIRQRLVSQAGDMLARFHQSVTSLVPAGRKLNGFMPDGERLWRDVTWHLETLEQYLEGAAKKKSPGKLDTFLLNIANDLKRDLVKAGRYFEQPDSSLPKWVIHGDYSPKNILFRGKNIVAVLDFGDACVNLRALDVARGVTSFATTGRYGVDKRLAQTFLRAYHSRQSLSVQEVRIIPDMIQWRYLQNIIWALQGTRSKENLLIAIRNKWEGACWIKTHAEALRASLLSVFEDR